LLEKFTEYIRGFDDKQRAIVDDFENKYSRKEFPILDAVYSYLSI